jgi:hypothetical protein
MLVNLGASLAQHGNGVLLVDACHSTASLPACKGRPRPRCCIWHGVSAGSRK